MQTGSLHSTRCCHEIYKLLEVKSEELLVGNIDFVFENNDLLIYRKSIAGKRVSLKIAEKSIYEITLTVALHHNYSILELFTQIKEIGIRQNLNAINFNSEVYRGLANFFALNYQKFV